MKVILVGGFIEIIELCESCKIKIVGIIDNVNSSFLNGYPVLGNDNDAPKLFRKYTTVPLVITPDSPILRKKLVEYYTEIGFSFISIISPKAEISKSAIIAKGVVIQSGVNISSNAHIEEFAKINTSANIMHDSRVGKFTTVAPNAVILGRVSVEAECYIGANSTILPGVLIQNNVTVGAGAVVVKNVDKNKTVKGIPAR